MKSIKNTKFDLKLNDGAITLAILKDLEQNLTPELFPHFHSGKLAKWLRVRNLEEQAEKVQALLVSEKEHQAQLFKNLCDIFGKNIDENEAREMMQNYKPSISEQNANDEEVEQLKAEIETLKAEIEQLNSEKKLSSNQTCSKCNGIGEVWVEKNSGVFEAEKCSNCTPTL